MWALRKVNPLYILCLSILVFPASTNIRPATCFLLGRPEPRSGRAYVVPVMFFFISPRFLRDPSTDRPETLPHDQNLAVFYKLTSKIRGASPKKIWGQKHAKFRSILDHFRL